MLCIFIYFPMFIVFFGGKMKASAAHLLHSPLQCSAVLTARGFTLQPGVSCVVAPYPALVSRSNSPGGFLDLSKKAKPSTNGLVKYLFY